MFQAAGFTEIDRRGTRPIYRLTFSTTERLREASEVTCQ
jgi:hypothetical protein